MPAALVTLPTFTKAQGTLGQGLSRSTNANLFTDIAALSTLTPIQRRALMVYFATNTLYSQIGASLDFRTDLPALRSDTALLFGSSRPVGIPGDQYSCADTAIAYSEAKSASSSGNTTTVSADIPTLLALDPVPHLTRYSMDELDRFWLFLRYLIALNG